MQQSDLPTRFPIPFANNAGASYIRDIPQAAQTPTTSDAPASLYDGFPPETFQPSGSGGIPPSGADFNGILNQITAGLRWLAAGGPAVYNSTFATSIGGYPKGAVLTSTVTAGVQWISTVENNTTDPDGASPSGWSRLAPQTYSTDVSGNWKRVAPDGFIEMGGILSPVRTTQGPFTVTFPFGGFPSQCLGIFGVFRNTTQSNHGNPTAQEISLSKTAATLYLQSHQDGNTIGGGMRWRAWGI
ncbi:hypothetical protein GCM10011349_19770 [Novosphingobium indicum]|uniref:Phage tail protein n=1 Tax=Novosphingobium indicum TaxID=462949 RepID=A0ABQ2JNC7_9SPHN|nr:hypothetical protein [Novosphingobium indicum]GGN49288.1 hypothetical protein GCM10011349_19770 [Novosphingobium indicum]